MKRIFFFLPILLLSLTGCSDDDTFTTSPSALLTFSVDTVRLDTVFSTVGSSTYTFWAYNHNDDGIRITQAYLRNRNQTGFRVNVDGSYLDNTTGSVVRDLEVRRNDSIRIFVELTAPRNMRDVAQQVSDDLVFLLESGVEQPMPLRGFAWDAQFVSDPLFTRDSTLRLTRPLVVYGTMKIAAGVTLTIRNTQLFFHDKGGIEVEGTLITDSVLMRGDRLDHMFTYLPYDRVSGQWGGITFRGTSFGNRLLHTEIRNATSAIVCDSAAVDPAMHRLYMERCVVHNSKGSGLTLYNTYAGLLNCQLSNALGDCLLVYGGVVIMQNCTLAQFYPFDAKRGVALRFFNRRDSFDYPLLQLQCTNTIITGYADDELMGTQDSEQAAFNYFFDHCLLRTPEVSDTTHFRDILWDKPSDDFNGKRHFQLVDEQNLKYDFHLDSISTAKGLGCY